MMSFGSDSEIPYLTELGDGLILRRATSFDGQALAEFNARIHGHEDTNEPDRRVGTWTLDLVTRSHPTFNSSDFTIVEDTKTGKIVSTLNLISQTWSYAGIPFQVGRPELVGTDPDFRNKGLVRAQMEQIHQWSAERGELVQGITGIPYYYRIFGYEMAMDLGGGRIGYRSLAPKLESEDEPYLIRPAEDSDLRFLQDLYAQSSQRYLVSCVRDKRIWAYELSGRDPQNVNFSLIKIIESPEEGPVGYIVHPPYRWGSMMSVTSFEVRRGVSWASVTPTVIRYLLAIGKEYQTEDGKEKEFGEFGFWLGRQHPVYQVIPQKIPRVREPYAWYLRVPDLPAFVRHVSPAIEARLADSVMVGHTGELKITFYNSGLLLVFEKGRLKEVEAWKPEPQRYSGDASFPGLTFLQLVFGYRSFAELKYAFADCGASEDQAVALLEILFPKQASRVWPIS
ncbi:MAG: GNAT family N-acetyltransferase [Chloroflexota bacterium]|nr:MAG: GNAT family N-acetyltransferase [Chloroflexota bacterium]